MLIFAGMVCSEIFSALFLTRLFRRNMRHIHFTRPDKKLRGQFFGIAAPLSASALIGNMLGSAGAVLLPQRLMAAGLDYEQALSALGVISGMAMPLLLFPVQPYLHIHRHAKRRPDDQKVHNIAAKIIFLCRKI